ncbi:MAG: ABC transporter ATP-binding protein, partial [Candidatus Eremiobacteraeota bacterium]|nr:ABC transporter ATP-binding protein [Candidatus Eremiobacteraeota bacterium]
IVCVLHDLNDAAAYADRIALLGMGTVQAIGAPDAVLGSDAIERTYGIAMERMTSAGGTLRVFPR